MVVSTLLRPHGEFPVSPQEHIFVVLYGFSIAYLLGPVIGVPVDSAHIVEFAHSLPEWAKLSAKSLLAAPFAYHTLNGVRHLAWDSTKREPSSSQVMATSHSGFPTSMQS